MGATLLSPEILEHVLQFADGETLLMCREVSPEFEAAVNYLGKCKNIWEKCYLREIGKEPYSVISKLHPHDEGFSHPKDWAVIYEVCFLGSLIPKEEAQLSELEVGKMYSSIQDVQTHGDLILVLVKYNKNFSIFYRILTINLDNLIVSKSVRFYADRLYITTIADLTCVKRDAVKLYCCSCQLVAVPVNGDNTIEGYPKFTKSIGFLTVEHSNGDILWMNSLRPLLSKGNAFHMGRGSKPQEISCKDSKCMKIIQRFPYLFIMCGDTNWEFNTFTSFRSGVTASMWYSNLLILGTDTGMLYLYHLGDESQLKSLDLNRYNLKFDVSYEAILSINVMELKDEFVIVCCSSKSVYRVRIKRTLKSFI